MKKVYIIRRGIPKKLKQSGSLPTSPSHQTGGIRARIKGKISNQVKQTPRDITKDIVQKSLDPYDEEEVNSGVDSLLQTKNSVNQAKEGYKQAKEISLTVRRLKTKVARKSQQPSRHTYTFRKSKGAGTARSTVNTNKATAIKTLTSKYVPKNKVSSLVGKNGFKKAASTFVKRALQQVVRKLLTAAAANPKGWLIGAVVGFLVFLMMTLTNSLGGTASSAGVAFMMDKDTAAKYMLKIVKLNQDFMDRIESYKNAPYDDVRINYMNEDGTLQISWVEMVAIVAVKYEQELEFSIEQQIYLEELFEKFTDITTKTEIYYVTVCSGSGEERECHKEQRTRLIVNVYTYDMEDVFDKIQFNEDQREWARRLVTSGVIQEQFPELFGGGIPGGESGGLTPEELEELKKNYGDIDAARLALIEAAVSLEGKVPYFWGGKSPAGWNPNWGKPAMVTAPGDNTTGTLQPYGLDCSGFIDWAFKTAKIGNGFGGGTSHQWKKTYPISEDEMIPGDFMFKNVPGQGGVNHVGIFIGKDQNGRNLFVHCQGGTGVVINSYKGFKYPRRPLLFK